MGDRWRRSGADEHRPVPKMAAALLAVRAVEGQGLAGSAADRLAGGPEPAVGGGVVRLGRRGRGELGRR